MLLRSAGTPLELVDLERPVPRPGEVLLRVLACGVCRTDLHIVDGELDHPKLPLVPGHQIVGIAEDGRRLGVPWLGWTCGRCRYCTSGRENLCERARFTGYDIDGGCRRPGLVTDEALPASPCPRGSATSWSRRCSAPG